MPHGIDVYGRQNHGVIHFIPRLGIGIGWPAWDGTTAQDLLRGKHYFCFFLLWERRYPFAMGVFDEGQGA